eukprot:3118013-Prymnesium_polylepis.1
MAGNFNPHHSHSTRRKVYMPMATERYFKENDKIPKKKNGGSGRPPKETEVLKVLKVTIL